MAQNETGNQQLKCKQCGTDIGVARKGKPGRQQVFCDKCKGEKRIASRKAWYWFGREIAGSKAPQKRVAEDLSGYNNGRFTVIRREPNRSNETMWLTECNECGKNKIARRSHVKKDVIRCGCQKKEPKPRYVRKTPRVVDRMAEAKDLATRIQAALDRNNSVEANRLAVRLLYRLRKYKSIRQQDA